MMGTCVIVFRFFTICGKHVSTLVNKKDKVLYPNRFSSVGIKFCFFTFVYDLKGDTKDAAAHCSRQHVQELLHHRGDVSPSSLLCICWSCSLRNRQIRREHKPVIIAFPIFIMKFPTRGTNTGISNQIKYAAWLMKNLVLSWYVHSTIAVIALSLFVGFFTLFH